MDTFAHFRNPSITIDHIDVPQNASMPFYQERELLFRHRLRILYSRIIQRDAKVSKGGRKSWSAGGQGNSALIPRQSDIPCASDLSV